MGLTQLAEKCKKCPFVTTCDHKEMEALAYLPGPEVSTNKGLAATPLLSGGINISINCSQDSISTVDFQREIAKRINKRIGACYES